jgi:hypothetical protein
MRPAGRPVCPRGSDGRRTPPTGQKAAARPIENTDYGHVCACMTLSRVSAKAANPPPVPTYRQRLFLKFDAEYLGEFRPHADEPWTNVLRILNSIFVHLQNNSPDERNIPIAKSEQRSEQPKSNCQHQHTAQNKEQETRFNRSSKQEQRATDVRQRQRTALGRRSRSRTRSRTHTTYLSLTATQTCCFFALQQHAQNQPFFFKVN